VSNIPLCNGCRQPLIRINFSAGAYLVCDNWQCRLFRERKGIITNNPTKATYRRPKKSKKGRPWYRGYLDKRIETYWRLRNLGVPANVASYYRGYSSFALLEAKIKAEGGVTADIISWAKDRRKDIRAERKSKAILCK